MLGCGNSPLSETVRLACLSLGAPVSLHPIVQMWQAGFKNIVNVDVRASISMLPRHPDWSPVFDSGHREDAAALSGPARDDLY